jgi:hypothetical protein
LSLFSPNILLSTLISNTLNLRFSLKITDRNCTWMIVTQN